ncbi:MAG: hypothetical protein U1E65_33310 [Myxococcota bacterium]
MRASTVAVDLSTVYESAVPSLRSLRIGWLWVAVAALWPSLAAADVWSTEFRGNLALSSEVYRTVLALAAADVPPGGLEPVLTGTVTPPIPDPRDVVVGPDPVLLREASRTEEIISDFLLASGYDLAEVKATVEGGHVVVNIDEGRLDKIIFVGQSVFRSLELQLTLGLPGRVYNRPLVERRLEEIRETFGIKRTHYEVAPVQRDEDPAFDFKNPPLIKGLKFDSRGQPHELHIYLEYEDRSTGLILNLGLGPPDGLAMIGDYTFEDVFLKDARLALSATFGLRVTDLIDNNVDRVPLSRARFAASWYTPSFVSEHLRGFLALEADLKGRVRTDIGLNTYFDLPLRASVNLEFHNKEALSFSLGGGVEQGFLFRVKEIAGATIPTEVSSTPDKRLRPMLTLNAHFQLNPSELRKDRANDLNLSAVVYPEIVAKGALGQVKIRFRYTKLLGFDEFRLRATGSVLLGQEVYYEQFPMSEYLLRAAYLDIWASRATGLGMEYRIALSRDFFKIGIFNDVAVAHGIYPDNSAVHVFESFGLSMHLLLFDSFQLDAFGGVGFSNLAAQHVALGTSIILSQAF